MAQYLEDTADGQTMLLILVMKKEFPEIHDIALIRHAVRLKQLSRSLRLLFTNQCNRALYPHEERRIEFLREKVNMIARDLQATIYINTDPRGSSIKILMPKTQYYNTMGGKEDGYAV